MRSITVSRVSVVVPWRAKTRPSTAAVNTTRPRCSCRRLKASDQVGFSGEKDAPVMATRRPPSASRASAEAICRQAASATRPSTCPPAENGGLISTTLGRSCGSRWSSMWAASKRVTDAAGKREASRPARVSPSSLSASDGPPQAFSVRFAEGDPMPAPPASSAKQASSPVPAEGSSTTSSAVMAAAVAATKPSGIGVENCCSAWLSSERRVWVGSRAATLPSMAS